MDTITLTYNGKTTEHNIYSKAEADALGLTYSTWRQVKRGGWALTDDGYVAQCLHIKVREDRGRITRLFVFAFWHQWDWLNAKLIYTGFKERGEASREEQRFRWERIEEVRRAFKKAGLDGSTLNMWDTEARQMMAKDPRKSLRLVKRHLKAVRIL